jgi:hypothetical protein
MMEVYRRTGGLSGQHACRWQAPPDHGRLSRTVVDLDLARVRLNLAMGRLYVGMDMFNLAVVRLYLGTDIFNLAVV